MQTLTTTELKARQAAPRALLPIPPELRNEIYSYLTMAENTSTTTLSPFKYKIYDKKQAKLSIYALSRAGTNLLALTEYQEAEEYKSFLAENSPFELRVSIVFKGRLGLRAYDDWAKMMNIQLDSLVKKYVWIRKVPIWNVKIFWEPNLDSLKGLEDGQFGEIVNGMLDLALRYQDKEVRENKGNVRVGVHLGEDAVLRNSVYHQKRYGLEAFFGTTTGAVREVREVFMQEITQRWGAVGQYRALRLEDMVTKDVVVNGNEVRWGEAARGNLVGRKVIECRDGEMKTWREVGKEAVLGPYAGANERAMLELLGECSGVEEARRVDE